MTHRVGSTEKAEELLGFRASVPLEEGLESVVEWRRSDQRVADRLVKIPIARPLFGPEELRAVQRPLESGWVRPGAVRRGVRAPVRVVHRRAARGRVDAPARPRCI